MPDKNRRHFLAYVGLSLLGAAPALGKQGQGAKEPPVPASVAKTVADAEVLRKAGTFAEAIALLEARQKELGESATLEERRALRIATADVHFYWASNEQERYEFRAAILHYQAAYELDKTERIVDACTALISLGLVYADLGEKSTALKFYNQALPLFKQIGSQEGEAATLTGLGKVYADLGEKSAALKFYNQALPLMRKVGNTLGEAATLSSIGEALSS